MTRQRLSWQKSMSKSGIDTRSGVQEIGSSACAAGSRSVMPSEIGDQRAGTHNRGWDRPGRRSSAPMMGAPQGSREAHLDDVGPDLQGAHRTRTLGSRTRDQGRAAPGEFPAPSPPVAEMASRVTPSGSETAAGSSLPSVISRLQRRAILRPSYRALPADRQTIRPSRPTT